MAYPTGINTANFDNCSVWNSQTGNVTAVGSNGGRSAYGTFDQGGNVEERADIFYLGGSYASSSGSLSISGPPSSGSITGSLATLGFRLSGKDYSQVYVLFDSPTAYKQSSLLAYSFSIVNEESYSVSLDLNSSFFPNTLPVSWSATYPSGSSGPLSGSAAPSGQITIGANSIILFNLSSNISSTFKTIINITVNITTNNSSIPGLVRNVFNHSIRRPFSLSKGSPNYPALFSDFKSQFAPASINEFVLISDSGNASITTQYETVGNVSYNYSMTKYEITNIEYCLFLNSIDPNGINPQGVYDSNMGSQSLGGINFISSNPAGQKYVLKNRMGNKPVNFVDWWCAARYCNWLQKGGIQYSVSDASVSAPQNFGAYDVGILISGFIPSRNSTGTYFVPFHNEWIKAGHYKGNGTNSGYWNFATMVGPTSGSALELVSGISANSNGDGLGSMDASTGNVKSVASWSPDGITSRLGPTTVGTNGPSSFYGLFDMAGNVAEITTANTSTSSYTARGGNYTSQFYYNFDLWWAGQGFYQSQFISNAKSSTTGFRIVAIQTGDIAVSATSSKSSYIQGENLNIVFNITNNSDIFVNNLRVISSFTGNINSSSLSWVASYPEGSSGPTSGTGNIDQFIVLAENETVTITFSVLTSINSVSPVSFSGSIIPPSSFPDVISSNNSVLLSIPVTATEVQSSLSGPSNYIQNAIATYTLNLTNNGPAYVIGATTNLSVSGDISALDWTASYDRAQGAASGTGNILSPVSIEPSGSATYTINVIPSPTTINNINLNSSLSLSSNQAITGSSVTSRSFTSVVSPTDLSIVISGDNRYTQNTNANMFITINNSGQYSPSGMLNFSLTSTVPPSSINWTAIYSSGSSGPLLGSGSLLTSGINLSNPGSATFNLVYKAPSGIITPIVCSGSVSTRNPLVDSVLSNNSGSFTSYLSNSDISISGSTTNLYYINNTSVGCKFTIINNSMNSMSGIVVSIPNPSNVTNQSWSATYTNGNGPTSGSGTINTSIYLANSGQVVYDISSIVSSGSITPILYSGSVATPSGLVFEDSVSSNNQSLVTIPRSVFIKDVKSTNSTCNNNGSITIYIDGGVPPFRYSIGSISSNSTSNNYTFNNLSPGEYNITVIDSTNFVSSYEDSIVIEDLNISLTINNIYQPTILDSFARIEFDVFGVGPFDIIFTDTSTMNTVEIGAFDNKYLYSTINNTYQYIIDDVIIPGTYLVTVTDRSGCKITEEITVPNISPLSVNVSVVADDPVSINSPIVSLDIFDTLLIPYKHIQDNSDLWQLVKEHNLKDNIYLWINNEKYEYKIVRTMLDKYCLDEDKIEILKLGNSYEDWYFYIYIAPSIDLTSSQSLIDAKIELGSYDESSLFKVVLGLSEDGQLEKDKPSLIKGSIILNGINFSDIVNGLSANVSVGISEAGLGSNDFELKNIKKSYLTNIYTTGVVTAINFLENFNVLNEYVSITQTSCQTTQENYEYLLSIKKLLLTINNFNNLNGIYLFNNNNTLHTGQLSCFATVHSPMITHTGSAENFYTTEYFTFDSSSDHVSRFIINNQEVKDVGVISNIDSRYVIARIKDNYNNMPKNISYDSGSNASYDDHFVKSQQIIQKFNPKILHDFKYGDILIFVPSAADATPLDPNPTPPTPTPTPTTPPTNTVTLIEMSKDSTETSSLQVNVFPLNTKCIIYGPHNYTKQFIGNVIFTNMVPGIYKIIGEINDLRTKNLYQNEYRIIINKNTATSQIVEFFSYANQLFISKEDH